MTALVDTKKAAEILGLSPVTLKKLRTCPEVVSLPPIPYRKYGPRCVRYRVEDLENWINSHGIEGGA